MVVYTLKQRWDILRPYFENHGNFAECVRKFGRREAPSTSYVRYLVREKPKPKRTPENISAVAESVCEALLTSINGVHIVLNN